MKELNFEQMDRVQGGITLVGAIDWGCAGLGAATFFFPVIVVNPVGLAFTGACVGWGIARVAGQV